MITLDERSNHRVPLFPGARDDHPERSDQTTVQLDPFRVKAAGAELVPLQFALKPGGELRLPPAGMEPL